MGRTKYWDGTKWEDVAPSAQEFDEHLAENATDAHNASNISVNDASGLFISNDVEGALKEAIEKANSAFTSASNGKIQVRDSVIGKGGTVTDADGDGVPTFQELVDGINTISMKLGARERISRVVGALGQTTLPTIGSAKGLTVRGGHIYFYVFDTSSNVMIKFSFDGTVLGTYPLPSKPSNFNNEAYEVVRGTTATTDEIYVYYATSVANGSGGYNYTGTLYKFNGSTFTQVYYVNNLLYVNYGKLSFQKYNGYYYFAQRDTDGYYSLIKCNSSFGVVGTFKYRDASNYGFEGKFVFTPKYTGGCIIEYYNGSYRKFAKWNLSTTIEDIRNTPNADCKILADKDGLVHAADRYFQAVLNPETGEYAQHRPGVGGSTNSSTEPQSLDVNDNGVKIIALYGGSGPYNDITMASGFLEPSQASASGVGTGQQRIRNGAINNQNQGMFTSYDTYCKGITMNSLTGYRPATTGKEYVILTADGTNLKYLDSPEINWKVYEPGTKILVTNDHIFDHARISEYDSSDSNPNNYESFVYCHKVV